MAPAGSSTVGLDIRATLPGFRAHFGRGTGRYTTELAARLIGKDWGGFRVEGISAESLRGSALERTLLRAVPLGRQTLHTQLVLPRRLGRLPYRLLHFPYHGDATARCPVPYAVTVLDLIPLRFPELYKPKRQSWRFRLARHLEIDAIKNAAVIYAISEATKADVVELLGVAAERIVVTPLGVAEKFSPRPDTWRETAGRTKASLALPVDRPVLLYYGGIDPRKNVPFLLEVMKVLLGRLPAGMPRPLLVLAGAYEQDERYPSLLRAVQEAGLGDSVSLPGFLSDEQLLSVIGASELILFPSLYEGFGLPLLEAMACGVPVIAGRNSSLREVMGRDEYLCKDSDLSDWAGEIEALLADAGRREERIRWGLERKKLFTWDRTAELTLAGYRAFLGAGLERPRAAPISVQPGGGT